MIQRIAGKRTFIVSGKKTAPQMEIDGAVVRLIVHIRIKGRAACSGSRERIVTGFVYRESLGVRRVVDQVLAYVSIGPGVHAAHMKILARDIVEIIRNFSLVSGCKKRTHLDFR